MSRNGGAGVSAPQSNWLFKLLWLTVAVLTSLIGVTFQRNFLDSFRIAKLALYEAEAVVCLALMLILLLWCGREVVDELRAYRAPLAIAAAAVLWTVVTTLTSTNRPLSVPSVIWVASCATVFIATLLIARRGHGIAIAVLPLIAAVVNAFLALTQRFNLYSPTMFEQLTPERYRISALIGNANEVGVYLFLCAVPAIALAFAYRGRKQWINAIAAIVTIALIATQTVSALLAFTAAALLMIVLTTRRVRFAAALVAFAILLVVAIAPMRHRAMSIAQEVRRGSFMKATSYRVPAYTVAWTLFMRHPFLGTGPGTYGWWYLPEKMRLNLTHPDYEVSTENYGEAHNDHLQTLAVTGIPGYVVFAAALVSLAALSFRPTGEDPRSRFAHALALPLAGGFAVVTLAQFPLEVACASSLVIHYAALCCAWADER